MVRTIRMINYIHEEYARERERERDFINYVVKHLSIILLDYRNSKSIYTSGFDLNVPIKAKPESILSQLLSVEAGS